MTDSYEALAAYASELREDPFIGCEEADLLKKNWLTDGMLIANYHCPKCDVTYSKEISRRVPEEKFRNYSYTCTCVPDELQVCKYVGSEARALNIMYKTTFEQNGRKGVKTLLPNGKQTVRSQTKENVLNGKSHKSVLTPAFEEKVNKEKQNLVIRREKQMMHEIARETAQRGKK